MLLATYVSQNPKLTLNRNPGKLHIDTQTRPPGTVPRPNLLLIAGPRPGNLARQLDTPRR